MDSDVRALRAFNRMYTQRIGVLADRYLGLDRPLGEARLLFEIGPHGAGVHELRERLELDSGYTSRLLRALEDDGLLEVQQDPADGRRRRAELTTAGLDAWQQLDDRSQQLARDMLDNLDDHHRTELSHALQTAERLLRAATATFEVVDPSDPDAMAAMAAYVAELDEVFSNGFDAPAAMEDEAGRYRAPSGAFVLVRAGGSVVGCGALQTIEPGVGEAKRMWIAHGVRGAGLGARLLDRLESLARMRGLQRLRLDTNAELTTAIALYRRAGYREIPRYNDNPYAHHWFEKAM